VAYAVSRVEVASLSEMFRALGDQVRLRIVALLAHGELCVCHIEAALDLGQSNASRHLGILRAAGLVTADRRDKWVYYRLAPQSDPDCARQLKGLVAAFSRKDVLRRDVERLLASKGPRACR